MACCGSRRTVLDSGWIAARASDLQPRLSGLQLTTSHPPPSPAAAAVELPWMLADVPGTVLGTLVKNNMIPDPFYGLENENIIDIADSGREYYTFWFFKEFDLPLGENRRAWLQFRGINYQGNVFLNGHEKQLEKGMFLRHILDVTAWINPNGHNYLAVCVHPPDHPGRIPPQGGQGGDHEIAKDVAAQYVEGWDWMVPIRDRNTGIWDEVSITTTGPVKVSDPHLVCSFFDNYKRVYLHSTMELTNTSDQPKPCTIKLIIQAESKQSSHCVMKQTAVVPGTRTISLTLPPIFFYRPELWWPNGMGKQTLHKVDIIIDVEGFGESDSWTHLLGIREIKSHVDQATGGRLFKVNGEPVFIRGGNWIVSDGLLRLSEKRYKSDIDFHADMNLNMIRCWAGGITERPEFYKNCDRRGILVWQEFWITGDNNGRGTDPPSDPTWPLDHSLFLECAKDTIKLLRNYASLALWVGGNEQHPASDLNAALEDCLQLHPHFQFPIKTTGLDWLPKSVDPSVYLDGSRIYIQGSLWDGFAEGNGTLTDGPYGIQNPEDFFKDSFYSYGFNPEVGSVGVPVAATVKATMPKEAWKIPDFVEQENGFIAEVPNPTWQYHKFLPYSCPGKVQDQIELYGEPKDLDDFCLKAQLANYVQYRSLMEGWTSRMWTKYTGVLIWKNQNPWTGLRGQLYDHLHDQTGGFFGVRIACEPIHVQLNLDTYCVEVVNTTADELENVSVEASIWDLNGDVQYRHLEHGICVTPKKTQITFRAMYPTLVNAQPVYFLLLKLINTSKKTLSRNFYWLHDRGGNYKALEGLRSKKAEIQLGVKIRLKGKDWQLKVHVENRLGELSNTIASSKGEWAHKERKDDISSCIWSRACPCLASNKASKIFPGKDQRHCSKNLRKAPVAFCLQLSVIYRDGDGQEARVLPVSYSDNYFSLVPGEKMEIDVSFENPEGATSDLTLVVSGWNIDQKKIVLSSPKQQHIEKQIL